VSGRQHDESRRSDLPRPLREVLDPTLERLATSDQARAFGAWARASGTPLSSAARPSAFFNGVLTVECASSVWANELTYMSGQILERMNQVSPGQPVRRLRFVVARAARLDNADNGPPPADDHRARLSDEALSEARRAALGVRDERLRAAIEAALEASSGDL
jgi:hypothetical protein